MLQFINLLHCLFGHDWDGCKCRRCGATRSTGHVWDGCICVNCGEARGDGHLYMYARTEEGPPDPSFVNIYDIYECVKCGKMTAF